MTDTVTFIHAADLHIGAPFKGLRAVSERWADRLTQAVPQAFEGLVGAALAHRVDFVVIAGDCFDAAEPSFGDYLRFVDGLARLDKAGIPVFLCAGNHDPWPTWQQRFTALPANTHLFPADGPGYFCYQRQGRPVAVLAGRSFPAAVWPQDTAVATGLTRAAAQQTLQVRAPFCVGVLHTGLDWDESAAPVDPRVLGAAGMDYWALGHMHRRRVVDDPADPHIVYSGCLQGRARNETGPHGANLVTLQKGRPNSLEFLPLASVVWACPSVDVASAQTVADMAERVVAALNLLNASAYCPLMIERVTLTGATPLHAELQQAPTLEGLRARINDAAPQFFCDTLIDATVMPIDRERLEREGLFPAAFLAACRKESHDRAGELAYLKAAFADEGIELPEDIAGSLDEMEAEAQNMVLDLLVRGYE